MTDPVKATGYLILKGARQFGPTNPETGLRPVSTAKITSARQSRPGRLERDEILIKVSVQLPASVFDPIVPQALVIVPEDLVLARHEIEVTADEDPEVAAP